MWCIGADDGVVAGVQQAASTVRSIQDYLANVRFWYTSPKFGTGFRAVSPVRASRPDRTARFKRLHQRFPLASASQQATRAISSVQHGRSGTLQPALRLLLPLLCVKLGVAHCAPHSLYRVLRWRCTRGCGEGDSCTLSCPPECTCRRNHQSCQSTE